MSNENIIIRNLYKIFGPFASKMVSQVKAGVNKNDLLHKFEHVLGLNNINLEIKKNDIHVIMGLSGSGKSTLIRHLNRLIEPTSGEIIINGINILELDTKELRDFRRYETAMVFQNFALFPHKTVLENIKYGLQIQKAASDVIKQQTQNWTRKVGLTGFENYYPEHLSGGMQQRVGLARALATDAKIILMDEPFSALDPLIRSEMQDILIGLQTELRKTIIFITHDLDEALKLGDHISILSEGEIIQSCHPQEIILRPVNDYVSRFTKNIDRGKSLQVGSIVKKSQHNLGAKIEKNESLNNAVKLMIDQNVDNIAVFDGADYLGSVELKDVLNAISGQRNL